MDPIFAPIVRLSSGEYALYSTCSFLEYAAYAHNVRYIYNRYDPKATIFMVPKEIGGVDGLRRMIEDATNAWKKSDETPGVLEEIPIEFRPPPEPEWITIGDDVIDGNLFTPYAITPYGFQLVVGFPDSTPLCQVTSQLISNDLAARLAIPMIHQTRDEAHDSLAFASEQAADFSLGSASAFVLFDISAPIKFGSNIFPVRWLRMVAGRVLSSTQSIVDDYILDTLDSPSDVSTIGWDSNILGRCKLKQTSDCGGPNETYCETSGDALQGAVNDKQQDLMNKLNRLFERGTIGAPPDDAKFGEFAKRWELIQNPASGLYHPSWRNTFITASPTTYLLQALDVGNDNLRNVDRDKLSNLSMTEAMRYISSPLINASYQDALRSVYDFYSPKPKR